MKLNSNSIHPLTNNLLDWYSINKRDLPWRDNPEPYDVWLAEIVFQQTRIEQGMAYYNRLKSTFPNVYVLANAEEEEVLKVWEGLGYYSRARNLHHSAKMIVDDHDGNFPSSYEEIIALKGIGPYTAAAISSIAFGLAYPAIDGNVFRVASRLFNIDSPIDLPLTRKIIENELKKIIDHSNPGDFNQAMMELGSLICKPQNPKCEECPVVANCISYKLGTQNLLPVKKKKVSVKILYFNFLVFYSDDKIIIEKRTTGIWKNLYQFPLKEHNSIFNKKEVLNHISGFNNSKEILISESEMFKHILSHRNIYAKFWMIKGADIQIGKNQLFIDKSELEKYPIPKLIDRFLSSDEAKYILLM